MKEKLMFSILLIFVLKIIYGVALIWPSSAAAGLHTITTTASAASLNVNTHYTASLVNSKPIANTMGRRSHLLLQEDSINSSQSTVIALTDALKILKNEDGSELHKMAGSPLKTAAAIDCHKTTNIVVEETKKYELQNKQQAHAQRRAVKEYTEQSQPVSQISHSEEQVENPQMNYGDSYAVNETENGNIIYNTLPEITDLKTSDVFVTPNESITIQAFAIDRDNDALTYTWECEEGDIISPNGQKITWQAPAANSSYMITLTVSDGHSKVTARLAISVNPQKTA